MLSYQELAAEIAARWRPARSCPSTRTPTGSSLVDEAHAFRNPDTEQYRALSRLMGGSRKKLCLMTATPVNNSIHDLYHQLMLFARHTAHFAGARDPGPGRVLPPRRAGRGDR